MGKKTESRQIKTEKNEFRKKKLNLGKNINGLHRALKVLAIITNKKKFGYIYRRQLTSKMYIHNTEFLKKIKNIS